MSDSHRIPARALVATLLLVALTTPAPVGAQAAAVFSACYVPGIGAIYMIKQLGLPQSCLSNAHAEVSWKDGGGELADGAIVSVKLANGSVSTAKIEDLAVTVEKLAAGAVTNAKLADGAVSGDKIGPAMISTTHIGDGQVTQAKLASDVALLPAPASVTDAMLADGAVTTSKLVPAAVTYDKLNVPHPFSVLGRSSTGVPGAIQASTDGFVLRRQSGALSFGQVGTDGIANGAVTTAKLAVRAMLATRFVSGTVTSAAAVNAGSLVLNAPGPGVFFLYLSGYTLFQGENSAIEISLGTTSLGSELGFVRSGVYGGTGTVDSRVPVALSGILNVSASGTYNVFVTLEQPATNAASPVSLLNGRLTAIFIPN